MTKKQIRSIVQLINISLLIIGFSIWFSMRLSIYYLFGMFIISVIISETIGRFIPVEDKKGSNSTSNKKNTARTITKNTKKLLILQRILTIGYYQIITF